MFAVSVDLRQRMKRRVRDRVRVGECFLYFGQLWFLAARSWPEPRQEDGKKEHPVKSSEEDHEEDHLEEHQEDVALSKNQRGNSENRADRTLENRESQAVQTLFDPVFYSFLLGGHVSVADVCGEVDRVTDAHDQVNHGDTVKVDVPESHVAGNSDLDGNDAESHPQRTDEVGDEDVRDDHHDGGSDNHTLH